MRLCRQAGVILLSALGMTACSGFTAGPASLQQIPPDAELVHSSPVDSVRARLGSYSGLETPERLVIRDADSWQEIWSRMASSRSPVPGAPEIDFSQNMVVLAAMGTRSSGGYAIAIDAVYRADGRFYAAVTETSPGEQCAVTGALTAPVDAVLVPRSDENVVFVDATAVHDCG